MATIDGVAIAADQEVVDLSGRSLTVFPPELLTLTNIKVLDLSNNDITSIPAGITAMVNLVELNMANNKLITIPAAMADMGAQLENLDVSGNSTITSLDASLMNVLHTNLNNPRIYLIHTGITVTNLPAGMSGSVYCCRFAT